MESLDCETMDKIVNLKLPRMMVGQIIDGLRERQKVWLLTAEFMETGATEEPYIIEECSDANEAKTIAAYYEEIINEIEKQIKELS
jgi:septal ring factor EnvC (AmiA/AmiB activator)